MNIFWHFTEFKLRFFYICFSFILTLLISYTNIDVFLFLITEPLKTNFIFINLFEGFYCFFIMSFFLSCFFILLVTFYSMFSFFKSGLTKNERDVFFFVIKLEFVISILSIVFSYQVFLPHLIHFLLSFEQNKIDNFFNFFFQARLLDYILISWSIFCLFFLLFQIPFLIFLSIQFQIVKNNFFIRFRREFIIFFLFVGCVLSPPDIYSQILIAFPCVFLYELVIFLVVFTENLLGELLDRLRGEFAKLWHTSF